MVCIGLRWCRFNYRMSNMIAVVCGQFGHLKKRNAKKKAIYERNKVGFAVLRIQMNPLML